MACVEGVETVRNVGFWTSGENGGPVDSSESSASSSRSSSASKSINSSSRRDSISSSNSDSSITSLASHTSSSTAKNHQGNSEWWTPVLAAHLAKEEKEFSSKKGRKQPKLPEGEEIVAHSAFVTSKVRKEAPRFVPCSTKRRRRRYDKLALEFSNSEHDDTPSHPFHLSVLCVLLVHSCFSFSYACPLHAFTLLPSACIPALYQRLSSGLHLSRPCPGRGSRSDSTSVPKSLVHSALPLGLFAGRSEPPDGRQVRRLFLCLLTPLLLSRFSISLSVHPVLSSMFLVPEVAVMLCFLFKSLHA